MDVIWVVPEKIPRVKDDVEWTPCGQDEDGPSSGSYRKAAEDIPLRKSRSRKERK